MSSPLTSSSAGSDQLRAVFQAYVDSWTQGDEVARRALFADDIVAEDPVGSPPMRGIDAWAKFWRDTAVPGAKTRAEMTYFVACGNEALAGFKMQISPPGDAPKITIEVYETLVFNAERKIAKLRAYWNDTSMKFG